MADVFLVGISRETGSIPATAVFHVPVTLPSRRLQASAKASLRGIFARVITVTFDWMD